MSHARALRRVVSVQLMTHPRPPAAHVDVEVLFTRLEGRLGQFLFSFVGDRELARDLLQDTFVEALRESARLADIESPDAWLYGIARHRALRAVRRRGRLRAALGRLGVERHDPHDLPEPQAGVMAVLRDHLAPEDRALLLLRYVHGLDGEELAAAVGISPSAARQRLSRVCRRLRPVLEDAGIAPYGRTDR